jgi:hypothetical protein
MSLDTGPEKGEIKWWKIFFMPEIFYKIVPRVKMIRIEGRLRVRDLSPFSPFSAKRVTGPKYCPKRNPYN